ncbi:MAG: hypothetical protein N2690_05810 [Rhodocyclaceae bacterium]|nr:hypothetical protein [Rhodocyclaceae bacterium]
MIVNTFMLEPTSPSLIQAATWSDLTPAAQQALQFALRRTSGLMIFAARPRYVSVLAAFRDTSRQRVPVSSRYERFDLVDALAEDVRGLLKVGLKGDVVDVGLSCANAFEALRVLAALGVPLHLLGSPNFWAGIVHLHPVRLIDDVTRASSLSHVLHPLAVLADEPQEMQLDAGLYNRVQMALGGAVDGVRLRHPQDPGKIRWYAEVLLPDPMLCAMLEAGRFQEAYEYWGRMAQDLGGLRAAQAALQDVAQGIVDPRDFEQEFGPIHWEHAVRDRMLQGYEVA